MFPLKIQNIFLIPHVLYAVTGFPLCHSIFKVIMDKKSGIVEELLVAGSSISGKILTPISHPPS